MKNNVDPQKFGVVAALRFLGIGALVGVAVGITALVAPAVVPAVAMWGGIAGGTLWAGSLAVSVNATINADDIPEDCEYYEKEKPSVIGKFESKVCEKVEDLTGTIAYKNRVKKEMKLAEKNVKKENAEKIANKLDELKTEKMTNAEKTEQKPVENVEHKNIDQGMER